MALKVEGEYERFSRNNRASTQRIKNLTIQVPEKAVQKKIVQEIDKIDKQIAEQDATVQKCDEDIQAKFAALFGIMNYPMQPLKNISTYFIGLTYKPENISDHGTIVLRSGNIQNSQIDFNDVVRVDMNIKNKLFVQKNDILMCSRNGSAKLVGKVALITELPEPMTFGTFMTIIRSPHHWYLWAFFQTPEFRQQISNGKTMSINQITTRMLDKVMVPLPNASDTEIFEEYAQSMCKTKANAQKRKESMLAQREQAIEKYFR